MKRLTFVIILALYNTILFQSAFATTNDPVPTGKVSSAGQGSKPSSAAQIDSVITGHKKEISLFTLSRDGRFAVTADEDENNFIWDAEKGTLIRMIGTPEKNRLRVVTASFSPESSQILWARKGKVMPVIWDVDSGRRIGVLSSKEKGHAANVISTAYSADGKYVATGDAQGVAVIWNRTDRSVVRRINAHSGEVRHLYFIPGRNELATAGSDGSVRLWGVSGVERLATLMEPSEAAVTALTGSLDGLLLYAATEDKSVKCWTVALRSLRGKLDFDNRQINSIALSPDSNFIALVEEDESVLLWNIRESRVAWKAELDNSATQVLFSPDGKRLFTSGGDNWIRIWNVASGQLIKKFGGFDE